MTCHFSQPPCISTTRCPGDKGCRIMRGNRGPCWVNRHDLTIHANREPLWSLIFVLVHVQPLGTHVPNPLCPHLSCPTIFFLKIKIKLFFKKKKALLIRQSRSGSRRPMDPLGPVWQWFAIHPYRTCLVLPMFACKGNRFAKHPGGANVPGLI